MINILTDSTSDISKESLKAYQIEAIPVYVNIDGRTYKDSDDIDAKTLFEEVDKTGQFPTTSAPSPDDFTRFFDRESPSIYIGVSSMLSSTFQNAQLAANALGHNNVDLIDSLSFSIGYGQIVLQASKWRNDGMGFEELGLRIRELVKKSRGIFILDTLTYLYHGGRCSAIEHFVSSLLRIHPFLNIRQNGTLGVLQKVRGSRFKAVEALWNYFKTQIDQVELQRIFLMHIDSSDEIAYLKDKLNSLGYPISVEDGVVGCALATHSGPKPLGIAYLVK
jgi:DegV family protein with EDD domain